MIQLDSSKRRILKGNNFLCIGFLNGSSFNQQTYFRYKKLRSQIFVGFNLFMIIGTFNFYDIAMGWERNTHKELTQKAIEIIEIVDPNFDTYLIDNLGLKGGFGESIDGTTVKEWVIEGGDLEDGTSDFSLRPRTHFHEPTTNTGLFGSFESAIEWSLKPVGTQDAEESYSWQDARDYFFRALTSETEKSRDENWGRTFRALGQIMHLLQDSANPSHVRDDAHISALGIGQVDGLHDYMARQSVASFPGSTFFTPDPSLLRTIHTEGPSDSLANLFDTNTYRGNNPGATLGNDVGIAEFTNANFLVTTLFRGRARRIYHFLMSWN